MGEDQLKELVNASTVVKIVIPKGCRFGKLLYRRDKYACMWRGTWCELFKTRAYLDTILPRY